MAATLFLCNAGWPGRALHSLEAVGDAGIHRSRAAGIDADPRIADQTPAAPPPFDRGLDHLEQLVLHPRLHSDLRSEDAPSAGLYRFYRDLGRWPGAGDLFADLRPLVGQDGIPAAHHDGR